MEYVSQKYFYSNLHLKTKFLFTIFLYTFFLKEEINRSSSFFSKASAPDTNLISKDSCSFQKQIPPTIYCRKRGVPKPPGFVISLRNSIHPASRTRGRLSCYFRAQHLPLSNFSLRTVLSFIQQKYGRNKLNWRLNLS